MKDLEIIEKILIEHGKIIDHATVSSYLSGISNINNKISSLIQKGLLVNIKKGVYYITKLGSLGFTSISSYALANTIGEESFVSFEGALKYHGIFDQGLRRYRSISRKQYLDKEIERIEYSYIKVKDEDYFGFETVRMDDMNVKIATKERSLLDLIEYQRTVHSVSLVLEKFGNYQNEIDFTLLYRYLKNYSQVTIKTLGLIFDLLDMDSKDIQKSISSKKSTHRMNNDSDKFDNKWRLYYDSILYEQRIKKNLSYYPRIEKYFGQAIIKYFEKTENPFDLDLLYKLKIQKEVLLLEGIERAIKKYEKLLGEKSLLDLFNEINTENYSRGIDFMRKLYSIEGELLTASKLIEKFQIELEKISEGADWIDRENNILYSVKTILDIDFNYFSLEYLIKSRVNLNNFHGYTYFIFSNLDMATYDMINNLNNFVDSGEFENIIVDTMESKSTKELILNCLGVYAIYNMSDIRIRVLSDLAIIC